MAEDYYYGQDQDKNENQSLNIQDFLYLCAAKWYWFLISFIVMLGLACLYILCSQPVYTRQASILIKDEDNNSSISSQFGQFSSMGIGKSNTNLYNEMITLKSPTYMEEVVRELHLDMQYAVKGTFHDNILYGRTLPVNVILPDAGEEQSVDFTLELPSSGVVKLSNFVVNGVEKQVQPVTMRFGTITKTPVGNVIVNPTSYYVGKYNSPIEVSHRSVKAVAGALDHGLKVELNDDNSSVVDLTLNDENPFRAEDVLNRLYVVYNQKWVEDINQQAISTSQFIDQELRAIEAELSNVDEDISSYKSKNMVPDVAANAALNLNKADQTSQQLLEFEKPALHGQVHQEADERGGLQNPACQYRHRQHSVVSMQIGSYNEKVLQRNNLVANSSASNPLVVDLDQSLQAMKVSIMTSINTVIATLTDKINGLQGSESEAREQIATNPTQAKYLLSVERQQKVKEELYTFLLQKREENQLSKAFTAYNTKMLNPPSGKNTPTKPLKSTIFLIAVFIALLIPTLVLLIINNLDTAVRTRKDLKALTIPFIGELPLSYKRHTGLLSFLNKRNDVRRIVVKEQSRNEINEAFRVVRTNLEFISGKAGRTKTIMFTSANAGSGKTFITMNLATSFAIKGKRVLIVDLDMRKASLSTFVDSPKVGISDYLNERVDNIDAILVKEKTHVNLDIIPVGTIPPNPTELLFSERLPGLLNKMHDKYDYIFIDCPPVEIVADASIVNKFCDMTVFVIRSGLLDRGALPDIEKYYVEKRYGNMVVIFNGTTPQVSGYGYHKYGYSYGYGYGNKH
jgi:tyrosine-protein kinase Etk/Wzc